jgi:HEXXH motif-containing protein
MAPEVIDHEVAAALDLMGAVWPEAICDLETFACALFVIESPAGMYPSGSDASLPFILKVTCAPGCWPALLADSLVHEVAHVKLRIAMRLVSFCDDDETPRFDIPGGPMVARSAP